MWMETSPLHYRNVKQYDLGRGIILETGMIFPVKSPCRARSEEHTSELQSPTHISYAVFCLTPSLQIGRAHV